MKEPVEPCVVVNSMPGLSSGLLTRFLYKSFIVVHDESDVCPPPREVSEISRLDPATLSAMKLFLFRGHFLAHKVRLAEVYPEVFRSRQFLVSTFLCDPLRTAAVLYLQTTAGMTERKGIYASFEEFATGRVGNGTASMLGCGRWTWRRGLARYGFVGIGERMEESIRLFTRAINEHFDRAPSTPNVARARYFLDLFLRTDDMANETPAGVDELVGSLPPDAVKRFREKNRLDYKIYEQALRRFDRLAGASTTQPS